MANQIRRLEDKCNACMLCVKDCATGVWRDVDGVPTPVAPEMCNLCSHCIAVCPNGAIEHDGLDKSQARKISRKLISAESYRETALTRRSVREFKPDPVPRKVIEDIIDVAKYSPTASNSQNVCYTIITDRDKIRKTSRHLWSYALKAEKMVNKPFGKAILGAAKVSGLAGSFSKYLGVFEYYKERAAQGKDYMLHNAPAVILIHAPRKASFACDNCNIAATNITNYAHALGLGTCFIGYLTVALKLDSKLKGSFNIPKGNKVYASLVLGYPTYRYSFTPSRNAPQIDWIEKD